MRIERNSLLPMLQHVAECADAKSESVIGNARLDATADIAAASKWLSEQVASDALPADTTDALHRAITTCKPRVEVTRKAVL